MPEQYIVPEDVIEELPGGRLIQVAAKGSGMPMDEARRRGLVKDDQAAGPQETKAKKDK